MIFQPRSLQQRTLFFILAPTLLLLVTLSVGGFVFVRSILLSQWGETAVVKLQRTGHLIDMELRRPKELLFLLQSADDAEVNRQIFAHIFKQIEELEGVVGVNVEWPESDLSQNKMVGKAMKPAMETMPRYRLERFEVGSPRYDSKLNNRTVSLISEFINRDDNIVGRVEVVISFDTLIEQILNAPWWKSNKAYLLDSAGNVLISTALELELEDYFPMRAFGSVDALEKETMAAILKHNSGTVFGLGSPPEEISGFYHLHEAPWTMVIMAPGEKVLQPIIRFKLFYVFTISICILLILFFIRQTTERVTTRIKAVSAAADDLAKGKFGPPLSITTRDEVSELAQSFNKMTGQLKHRLEMKEAINIAREVQQNLLPSDSFLAEGIEASGVSLYCDETGGDYFDIINFPDNDRKVSVVVGDVVGHGIGAALLMTTVRALLRCRVFLPGRLDEIINDVNRFLWRDTSTSGNFVTLFYLEVDRRQDTMRWVRGGHDPAMVYSAAGGEFSELKGNGVALGIDADLSFEYNELPVTDEEQLVLIGSDGAWEVENGNGEQFGKDRIRQILAATSDLAPDEILQAIIEEINEFRGDTPQNDDITLVVVKIC
ncbi:MAG: SpoIIE family protein phosphatase [Desulfobulbaceae bacterium]|nr:SpoIIE family protein phosphatase [Desulfobulbaceae bacterium]